MKNELTKEIINLDDIKVSWKKTLVQRRIYIQNHTTKEVVKEFPGYTNVLLVNASLFSNPILIRISFLLSIYNNLYI